MDTKTLTKIMMVEDEPDIQAVARVALENLGGFTMEVCNSGVEALGTVRQFDPDLILMDVMMPEKDGPTTLQELRGNPDTAAYPVIFMTAKAQPQEIARFKSIGALDVISKPFDPMTLADTVKSIWETRHAS